ncbi:hypothetical protein B0H14DRAFT_3863736 [Mycena olivaceomarginata]|nr:hypothetical protein B0H14DRAFT_3863736 [Mycena olivaceomarginata]
MALDRFDYVMRGGGTARLVVAARLVEDPTVRVCVIEAGEDVTHELNAKVPSFGMKNLRQPNLDWGFIGSPQVNANGRSLYLSRQIRANLWEEVLNLMIFGRGHEAEHDAFESLGSPGWSWEGLVPYFKASEAFAPSEEEKSRF